MKQRPAERYRIPLDAVVMSAAGGAGRSVEMGARVKDISSRGVAFYSEKPWERGRCISMLIDFGEELVGPFSYAIQVEGRIVREGVEEENGKVYYAVELDGQWKILNWHRSSCSPPTTGIETIFDGPESGNVFSGGIGVFPSSP